jgi:flagellar biosynthesis protein
MAHEEHSGRLGSTSKVAALAYDPMSDAAPRLVGKGSGAMAERILAIAHEKGIPIQKDPGLVQFLMRVDLEERIPAELYAAVASVLAMVWLADRAAADRSSEATSSGQ